MENTLALCVFQRMYSHGIVLTLLIHHLPRGAHTPSICEVGCSLYMQQALIPSHKCSSSLGLSGPSLRNHLKPLRPTESLRLDIFSRIHQHVSESGHRCCTFSRLQPPSSQFFQVTFHSNSPANGMHSTCRLTIKAIRFEYITMSLPFRRN